MCGALSPRGELTVVVGVRGDTFVMCPAEGDSLGAAKDLAAGPDSLPPGIKTENILPLMASDSRLNYTGVLKESVVISVREGCSTGSIKRKRQKETIQYTVELEYVYVSYLDARGWMCSFRICHMPESTVLQNTLI